MDDDSPKSSDLGAPHSGDSLVRVVARSRIEDALFETGSAVSFGRYRLLERAGAGGFGVVWSAWDPQLERRVAIKIVKPRSAATRETMMLEGQALAKLAHPNVVTIYDVGSLDDQVYLVMEWIAGVTFRGLARPPRNVVANYLAAGAGLAAAHRAGIVHRDIKPDNLMLGDDGRVRVVDFGLARAAAAEGEPAGTPRYQAPEQAEGRPATALSDQYAFGVSLRESLGEVPRWIEPIIARSTATIPADRFPTLEAMLARLGRDPRRVWRRRALFAGAVIATGLAFEIGHGVTREPCSTTEAELASVWNPGRETAVLEHVRSLGPYGMAVADEVTRALASYRDRWVTLRRDACLARGELTDRIYEHRLSCLQRARAAPDATASAPG